MSRSFMHMLGAASPSLGTTARAADIVAAMTPPSSTPGVPATALAPRKSATEVATEAAKAELPALIGAGAGALLFRKSHPVLGALAGHAVVACAHPLITGKDRKRALCQLAVEGAGIGGALWFKKHPFLGWLAGIGVGLVATSFVKGSPTNDLFQKWKG